MQINCKIILHLTVTLNADVTLHIISCTDSVLKTHSSVIAPSCTADVVTVYAYFFPILRFLLD